MNGVLYFSATDGTNGRELWKSDGTAAGTARVADIDSGAGSSYPSNLTNVNGVLYFRANDGTRGTELWKFVNEAPTALTVSPGRIAENAGVDAVVGSFVPTDPDAGDTFTYTLVTGTGSADNAKFNIIGNQLRANAGLDFELGATRGVRVRVTDQGGLSFEQALTITVTDVADGPSVLAPTGLGVVTNQSSGLSGLSVVDPLAGLTRLTTTLSVASGKMTLGTRSGLLFLVGDGVSDGAIKFTGTLSQTNAALKSLSYITAADTLAGAGLSIATQRGTFTGRATVSLTPAEGRVVRVSDPVLAGKVSVMIHGTGSRDTVSVQPVGTSTSSYTVRLNGVTTTVTGITGRIVAFGLGGNDDIDLSLSRVAVRADGGEGNDVVLGGRLSDALFGGNGADLVAGGLGADSINGGAGNDIVVDGSVVVKAISKSHRSVLDQWAALPSPLASDYAALTADTTFTPDRPSKDSLTGGVGADWFWSATAGAVADTLDRLASETRRLA